MLKHFTRHMSLRMRQRGKSAEGVRLVMRYGKRRAKAGDGVMLRRREVEREMDKRKRWLARLAPGKAYLAKAMRRRIRTLEQMRGCVVVEKHGELITIYDRARRFRRGGRPRKRQ